MIEVFRDHVDSEDNDYLQCLFFEKEAYKEILGFILLEKQKGYPYNKENYEFFMNEFQETNKKFRITFQSLVEIYAPEYSGDTNYHVTFNFENGEIIVNKYEEGEKANEG